ncbi:sensor histidine kinase [Sporofaciens musculi]|uniref:sensor histidine kinase n=1 Tax=Sporofaciens musculi TaxID=2681861 RepID=UPI00257055FF|nr:sensor histidine kinase [Sporofaciens musculi]
MKTTRAFFRERKRELGLCAILLGTFAVVSYLYGIRMDAVEYALLLSAVWALLLGIPDYLRFVRRHKELLEAEKGLESGIDGIPDACTLLEEDYQRIITRLYEARIEAESAGRIARQEMVDYYGMWVHQIKTPIAAMYVLLQALEECQLEDEGTPQHTLTDEAQMLEEDKLRGTLGHPFRDEAHWPHGGMDCGAPFGYLKEMKMELFKIEQYVEMVLTYLRMEEMSSDLSFESCSLDSIIKQAVRKYSQMFILKKIQLVYTPIEMKVLTDEKWLVFVLEQILSNALKYTSAGKISVYTKGQNCLVIEDTGIGIWPEDLPRVFEKGFTGYNGRKDKKSTGIGLYLCKSVIDKLKHQIWIESEAGKGTKVYLSLQRNMMRHE